MYLPPHFAETDPEAIRSFIAAHPLAMLAAQSSAGLIANHIPLLEDEAGALIGHIALGNDLHRLLADGAEALAVFRGEDAYVSPNWYPSKARHGRHVPTWNYEAVHIYGDLSFQHDVKAKRAAVGRLTKAAEQPLNGAQAWRMADAPADYMAVQLEGIVALRLEPTRRLAKSKLSQNRDAEDFDNVARELSERGATQLAARMRKLSGRG